MQDRNRPEGSHQQFVRIPFIIISLAFGIWVWVMDSLLDFLVFHKGEGTFLESLGSGISKHEIYMRLAMVGFLLIFGIIMSKFWTKREKMEKARRALSSARDITAVKQAEMERERLNRSLTFKNKELERRLGLFLMVVAVPKINGGTQT